jgi:adenine/guanine phosphoribosyltransferase-like PRPP-binding protein
MAPELVPAPGDGVDVCPMCRSARVATEPRCENCTQAVRELTNPCEFVVPITLYQKPSMMRERITNYKDGSDAERQRYAPEVAAIVDRFFAEFGNRLAAKTGGWDSLCVVPSSKGRPLPHPLEAALDSFPTSFTPAREQLLTGGVGKVGHRDPNENAFLVSTDVRGERILLLDDVYTTGAEAQSAASVLEVAGATVVGILVIARRINPGYSPRHRKLWDRQVSIPFRFTDPPWWAN